MAPLPYDISSRESILAHARKLLGKSLWDLYQTVIETRPRYGGKGRLGQDVERYHFRYRPNSANEPDFAEAELELKCTPLKSLVDGSMVSKERLVLNILNYEEEAHTTFWTSGFWRKNAHLLLMFYHHRADCDTLRLIFRIVRLWEVPHEDLGIFISDWTHIHRKICSGHAHDLHEGETFYLTTCPKGSRRNAELRTQPNSDNRAPQRAYAIKSSYINHIILDSLDHPEMVCGLALTPKQQRSIRAQREELGSLIQNRAQNESLEAYVAHRFATYQGKTIRQVEETLGITVSQSPKAMAYALCRAIFGIRQRRIAEFEKADVALKTIRLEANGTLKEAMSFPVVRYEDICREETWEESAWYHMLTRRFLFVVFRKATNRDDREAILEGAFFWAIPAADLAYAKTLWFDTREKVRQGDYTHFLRSSQNPVCHIRPKARNAADLTSTPQGGQAKKYCYWLNRKYILSIVRTHLGA